MPSSPDWAALGFSGDPLPGDPAAVAAASTAYLSTADTIRQAARSLRSLLDDDRTVSEAVDTFRESAEQVAQRIGRAEERYRGTGAALRAYAPALRSAQDLAGVAVAEASAAAASSSSAADDIRRYDRLLEDPALDPAERARIDGTRANSASEASRSAATLQTAITTLQEAIDARDAAATVAADAIHDVEQSSALNDSFWDDVDQFFAENQWIDDVLAWAGVAATILMFAAMFVPGLNLIALGVLAVVTAATVANAVLQALTGNKSLLSAATDIACALAPLGTGRAIKSAFTATRTVTAASASTSQMASAAGSGVSGITRPVASAFVDTTARRAVEAARIVPLEGTEARMFAETAAIAKMTLRSGAVSRGAKREARKRYVWAGGYVANAVVPAYAPKIVEDLPRASHETRRASVRNSQW